ncbi:MAG: MBOAT family O-acyltransferase [Acidobacteriota bacterium]
MLFTSYTFLFVFLPVVLTVTLALPAKQRNAFLAVASYVFYAQWNPWFLLLLVASTLLDYRCGALIAHSASARVRRLALAASLSGNLGLLGVFKYAGFVVSNLNTVLAAAGASSLPVPQLTLPVGISFFTFQSMSYSFDLYRGAARPARSLLDFATYVALFPQLVAGPILRYRTLAEQLAVRTVDAERVMRGLSIFSIGLAKKVLLANNLAPVADGAFAESSMAGAALTPGLAWIGTLAYALQIYFDFSGYSDMAIGLGLCLGFVFPQNFDAPYRSRSITDFWRRWHISLSQWLRDYLYIPLGGNRGSRFATYRNLALTMLLGGLWHGAAWTFVVWGALHGLLLALERARGRRSLYAVLPTELQRLCTGLLVLVTWVFFRAESLSGATFHLAAMFGVGGPTANGSLLRTELLDPFRSGLLIVALVLATTPWRTCDLLDPQRSDERAWKRLVALLLFGLSVLELSSQGYNPFLYFQF